MKLRSKLLYSYIILLILYSGFVLVPKPTAITLLRFHVSAMVLRIIYITIILLLAAIWYVGFYGYAKLDAYAKLIRKSKDGKHVDTLAKGIFLLALWLPISSVTSIILNYFAMKHLNLIPAVTIINNYVSLLLPLLAFIYISMAARGLSDLAGQRPTYLATCILGILLIYIGLIDYHLVISIPNRESVYHMSIWLMLTTLIAPYIYMWFMGLLSTYEIYRYQRKVAGSVYRKSWNLLALGIGWLIVMSIAFQYLITITNRLGNLSIYWLLAIIYALLLILSVGYILIAVGTRKLQRIEEV